MLLTKTLLVTTVAATALAATVVVAGEASASPAIAGTYNTITPVRVLNTIDGTGAVKGAVGPGKSITFDATAKLGTKLVSAEALNVEAVGPTSSGLLNVYTGGTEEPATSTLNYYPGSSTANEVLVGYGSSGTVTIHNVSRGSVNIVADISGYWTGGSVAEDTAGAFNSLPSTRILDTRTSSASIPASSSRSVPALGQGGIPASGVSAVAVNVTVPTPAADGYVAVTAEPVNPSDGPKTSDVNFYRNQIRANLVVVPVDADGNVSLYNAATVPVNAIIDVVGYFSDGSPTEDGSFQYFDPYRSNDTRLAGGAIGAGASAKLQLGVGGGSESLFKAVVANLTITGATKPGYITAWDGTGTRPSTSDGNFAAKHNTAITAITPINSDGTITVFNGSTAPINLVLDVHGFVLNDLSGTPPGVAKTRINSTLTKAQRAATVRLAS